MDKSEITEMPEGMTSEELDNLTTGEETESPEDLAQAALDATQEDSRPAEESVEDETPEEKGTVAEKPEVDPKDAVIGDFRRKLRDEELKTAKLEGEIEARKSIQVKPEEVVKSPLDLAEAAWLEEHDDLDDFTMDGVLYRRQRAFDEEQAEKKAGTTEQTKIDNAAIQAEEDLLAGELSEAQRGQGLDLRTVAGIGTQYLTKGDKLDIADIVQSRGSKAGLKEAYNRMVQRTLAAKNEDSKLLENAISKTRTKPKKQTDIDALTIEGEVKGEAETDTPNARMIDFIFSP